MSGGDADRRRRGRDKTQAEAGGGGGDGGRRSLGTLDIKIGNYINRRALRTTMDDGIDTRYENNREETRRERGWEG